MARKSISLSEKDRIDLVKLTESGDEGLALRAQIVLDCSTGMKQVDIAIKHNITDCTVRKWRDRYIGNGISGLIVVKPGMSAEKAESVEEATQKVIRYIGMQESPLTPKEIAQALNMPLSTVYTIANRYSLPLARKRTSVWHYNTADTQIGNGPYLAGLYVSYDGMVYVLCETEESLDGRTIHGTITLWNQKLWKEINDSAATLRLADTVYTAKHYVGFHRKGITYSANDFLSEVIDGWPDGTEYHFHVLYTGKKPNYKGSRILGLDYMSFESFECLRNQVMAYCADYDNEPQFLWLIRFLQVLRSFYEAMAEGSNPFVWRMMYGDYSPLQTILNSPIETPQQQSDKLPEDVEAKLKEFLGVDEKAVPGIKTVLCMTDGTGQMSFKVVGADALFPDIDEDSISAPETFDRTINQLDRSMTELATNVNLAGRDLYFTNLKKTASARHAHND